MTLIDIEQNDVDISKLFAFYKEITVKVPGSDREIKFFVRVLTDEQRNIAQTKVLRECADLRKNLKNPKWEDRGIYLPDFTKAKKEEVIEFITSVEYANALVSASNSVQIQRPPELPEEASLEDQEKWQLAQDEHRHKVNEAILSGAEEIINKLKKDLNKISADELKLRVEHAAINSAVTSLHRKLTRMYNAFYGTYLDKNFEKPAFKTFEAYKNTPRQLLDILEDTYEEVNIGGSDLKKLPEVMP